MSNVVLPDTISVTDLSMILAEQWGPVLPISLKVSPGDVLKKTQFVRIECHGCKTKRSIEVSQIVNLIDDNEVCDNCHYPYGQAPQEPPKKAPVQAAQPDPTPEPEPIPEETREEAQTVETIEEAPEESHAVEGPAPRPIEQTVESGDAGVPEETMTMLAEQKETAVFDRLSEQISALDERLSFSPFQDDIGFSIEKYNETGIVKVTNFKAECTVCGETCEWPNEEAVFDDKFGIGSVISLEGMGSYTENDLYHNCKNCLERMSTNNGINPYLYGRVSDLASVKSLGINNKELKRLHSPTLRVPLIGANGQKISLSMFELVSSKIPDRFYDKVEEVKPVPAPKAVEKKEVKAPETPAVEVARVEVAHDMAEMFSDVDAIVTPVHSGIMSGEQTRDSLVAEEEKKVHVEEEQEKNRVFSQANRLRKPQGNPFQRADILLNKFNNSACGRVIAEIARQSKVGSHMTIDNTTLEIPVVDFETGIRIICIDLDKPTSVNLPEGFDNHVPFAYPNTEFSRFYLYSDSATYRPDACVLAAVKIIQGHNIGETGFIEDNVVDLASYTTFYTTNSASIQEFENENAVMPFGKPSSGRILLLAVLDIERRMNEQELWKFLVSNRRTFQDMNMYAVASMRWIAVDSPTEVRYTITQYTELGETWLRDGFQKALGALTREHQENFPGKQLMVEFEFDRTTFPAPSLKWFMEREQGLWIMPNMNGSTNDWVYVKDHAPEFRNTQDDFKRQDQRFFTLKTLVNRYSSILKESGGIDSIRDQNSRAYFIKSMGYVRCSQPALVRLMVSPAAIWQATADSWAMFKIDPAQLLTGGITSGREDDNAAAQNFLMMKVMMDAMANNAEAPVQQQAQSSTEQAAAPDDMMQMMFMMSMFGNS